MAYIVKVETGRGKKKSISQSVPLPNKKRVSTYIKRNPLIKSGTEIKVKDTRKKKTFKGTKGKFLQNPITNEFRY
ncbi:MAG: hypothetical protein ACOC56_01885 [Atribacterota bacterium]